jgi:sugar phosphate permease
VFLTILAHAVEGTVAPQFIKSTGFAGADKSTRILLYAAGWFAVAIALVLLDRQLWRPGNRRRAVEAIGAPLPTAPPGLVS